MTTLLEFIARISPFIYGLAAIGTFFALRRVIQGRNSLRIAVFGLEREAARNQLRSGLSTIFTLALMASVAYIITNIVVPNLNGSLNEPTPTPVVFVTQQITPTEIRVLFPTVTPTAFLPSSGTAVPTFDPTINGCEILGARILEPAPNQPVAGQVVVQGEANILNQAQYKFELRGATTGNIWVVVGTFPGAPVPQGYLGSWDSTSLIPGNYTLRLIVMRDDGSFPTPCEVPIVVTGSGGAVPTP
jgi:hypothetical protein